MGWKLSLAPDRPHPINHGKCPTCKKSTPVHVAHRIWYQPTWGLYCQPRSNYGSLLPSFPKICQTFDEKLQIQSSTKKANYKSQLRARFFRYMFLRLQEFGFQLVSLQRRRDGANPIKKVSDACTANDSFTSYLSWGASKSGCRGKGLISITFLKRGSGGGTQAGSQVDLPFACRCLLPRRHRRGTVLQHLFCRS